MNGFTRRQSALRRFYGFASPLLILAALALSACAGTRQEAVAPVAVSLPPVPQDTAALGAAAHIVETSSNLQCVAYARSIGSVELYGDAWTWWHAADGVYSRGSSPRVGAVLVLQKHGASRGHVAVIRQVVDSRLVIAEHANWLNRGEIEMNSPIIDVSPDNDWSAVRVWYVPAQSWGITTYPAYGFIYPEQIASL